MGMGDEEIYRKYADDLVRFATGIVGPFDAPDVVTDAWLRATKSASWTEVRDQKAYLYRVVVNVARSSYRRSLRRRLREQSAAQPDVVYPSESDLDVLDALDRLSEQQRAVVVLVYWEAMTLAEVAEVLDVSEGTVKRHHERAKSKLRKALRTHRVSEGGPNAE